MRNGSQVTLQGAEAIQALRKEMDVAGGTASRFRDKLLDTFEGQKTLLAGTLQTLGISLGEPFAQVLKPIVGVVTGGLNLVIKALAAIPAPMKRFLAGLVVAAGAFVALVGAAITAKAVITIGAVAFAAFGATLIAAAKVALVLAAVFGVIVAAVMVFRAAWERDLGGIATFFRRVFANVSLIFSAIQQLFSGGGFSGAVRDELAKAENAGIKAFAIKVFMLAKRIGAYFAAMGEAISGAFEALGPVVASVRTALSGLGNVFADIFELLGLTDASVAGSMSTWSTFGAVIGSTLGAVIQVIAFGLAGAIRGMVLGFRIALTVVRNVVSYFRLLWDNAKLMIDIVAALLTGDWSRAWDGARRMVFNVLRHIVLIASGFVELIASMADQVASLFGKDLGAEKAVRAFRENLEGTLAAKLAVEGSATVEGDSAPPAASPGSERPRAVEGASASALTLPYFATPFAAPDSTPSPAVAQVIATREILTSTSDSAASRERDRPIQVNATLELDGQTVAHVVHNANSDSAARSFSPVPSY